MKLFPQGQGSFIKILSLAIGLTIGLVLIAKVQLEYNYEPCIPDKASVYQIYERFQLKGEDSKSFGQTPGGVVLKMRQYIPEVVDATRFTWHFAQDKIYLENGDRYWFGNTIYADSCFFGFFDTRILQGNARQILGTKGECLISRSLYERLGGDVVGKSFSYHGWPDRKMTIAGVFENYEENTRFGNLDIIMSLPSIGIFIWDGSEELMGNDRYSSYVRLHSEADMEKVNAELHTMLQEIIPWDDLHDWGYADAGFDMKSIVGQRLQDSNIRTTCIILLVVALVMLFTSVMNYILVVISSLVSRARQVALRKCIGAPDSEFYLGTLREAVVHLLLALLITSLLLTAGESWIRQLMNISLDTLFSYQTYWVLAIVCLVVLLCCGLLPGYIYNRIPVNYAFRRFRESKKAWKLSLLAFQFVMSTLLVSVLWTVYRQYNYLLDKDLGYRYDQVAYIPVNMPEDSVMTLEREIEKLPGVVSASACSSLFCEYHSGNNIHLEGDVRELLNYTCLYYQEGNITETLQMEILQGRGFTHSKDTRIPVPCEVMVDERFAQYMQQHEGWDDVVGREVMSSEFGNTHFTIVGIFRNVTLGCLAAPEMRPSMMFNGVSRVQTILVRLHEMTPEEMLAVQEVCNRMYPEEELVVGRYSDYLQQDYREIIQVRDLLAIGCLATLLVTLIGLIGYLRDEIQRRGRELAIRQVHGATTLDIQFLFLGSMLRIALPTLLIGAAIGYYLSQLLLQEFAHRIDLSPLYFVASSLFVLSIIASVVLFLTWQAACENPVKNLKSE